MYLRILLFKSRQKIWKIVDRQAGDRSNAERTGPRVMIGSKAEIQGVLGIYDITDVWKYINSGSGEADVIILQYP